MKKFFAISLIFLLILVKYLILGCGIVVLGYAFYTWPMYFCMVLGGLLIVILLIAAVSELWDQAYEAYKEKERRKKEAEQKAKEKALLLEQGPESNIGTGSGW